MRKLLTSALLVLLVFLVIGCGGSSGNPPSFEITHLYWYGESLHPSYTATFGSPDPFTAALNFDIKYSGDISYSDIEKIIYTSLNTGIHWTLIPETGHVDNSLKIIHLIRCYLSDKLHVIPTGDFRVDVYLKGNSTPKSISKTFGIPGDLSPNGKNYLYSESYAGPYPSDYGPLLKWAQVSSLSKLGTEIKIDFTVNDNNVNDGWLWFYDSNKKYIGNTSRFNEMGLLLNKSGVTNTITLQDNSPYFHLASPATFSNISGVIVVLCDGAQYPDVINYDYRSISEYKTF